MKLDQNPIASKLPRNSQKGWWISALAAVLFAGSELVAFLTGNNHQLWSALSVVFAAPLAYWLVITGRRLLGNTIFIMGIAVQIVFVSIDLFTGPSHGAGVLVE
ncbi:MAG TPA: hypothetical protein VK206_23760, partial [Anaerolineales bacterium]|nr:hypothetical protein [Anaerolineales bacterium]